MKQAKLERLQNPGQTNGDDLNNVRRKEGISERKINKLETNSKNKNIRVLYRGIN
jgi:hypothetical protein